MAISQPKPKNKARYTEQNESYINKRLEQRIDTLRYELLHMLVNGIVSRREWDRDGLAGSNIAIVECITTYERYGLRVIIVADLTAQEDAHEVQTFWIMRDPACPILPINTVETDGDVCYQTAPADSTIEAIKGFAVGERLTALRAVLDVFKEAAVEDWNVNWG